jgi:aryl-alcohol dehydrogenase-like predicted oxidoreductase
VQVAVDEALLDLCAHDALPILAYSPLLSCAYVRPGVALDRAYLTADNKRRLAAARRVAEDSDLTVNQLVLAWLRQSPAARVVPIVAASSTEQLDESLDALSVELTAQQLTALDEAPTVYGTWSTTSWCVTRDSPTR